MVRPGTYSFLLIGAMLTFVGAIAGFALGATYGGNYPVTLAFGGLPGYEGTALLGAIVLSSLCAIGWTWIAVPKENRSKAVNITAVICLAELVIQSIVATQTGTGLFFLLFIPIFWQAFFAPNYAWKKWRP